MQCVHRKLHHAHDDMVPAVQSVVRHQDLTSGGSVAHYCLSSYFEGIESLYTIMTEALMWKH